MTTDEHAGGEQGDGSRPDGVPRRHGAVFAPPGASGGPGMPSRPVAGELTGGGRPVRAGTDESPVMRRQVNDLMRWGLDARDPSEPIAFFCECEQDDCYRPVWLTTSEYDVHPAASGG